MTLRENRPAANQGTRGGTAKKSGNPREVEYRLFQKINRALMSAGADERTSQDFLDAIENNRRLWDTLRTDLESDSNWLAKDLKAKLISLALWGGAAFRPGDRIQGRGRSIDCRQPNHHGRPGQLGGAKHWVARSQIGV